MGRHGLILSDELEQRLGNYVAKQVLSGKPLKRDTVTQVIITALEQFLTREEGKT